MKNIVKVGLGLIGIGAVVAYTTYKKSKNEKAESVAKAEFEKTKKECDARVDEAFKRMKDAEESYNKTKDEFNKKMAEQEKRFKDLEKENDKLNKEIQKKDEELETAKKAFAENIVERHKAANEYIKSVQEKMNDDK